MSCLWCIFHSIWQSKVPLEDSHKRETLTSVTWCGLHLLLKLAVWSTTWELTQEGSHTIVMLVLHFSWSCQPEVPHENHTGVLHLAVCLQKILLDFRLVTSPTASCIHMPKVFSMSWVHLHVSRPHPPSINRTLQHYSFQTTMMLYVSKVSQCPCCHGALLYGCTPIDHNRPIKVGINWRTLQNLSGTKTVESMQMTTTDIILDYRVPSGGMRCMDL